MTIAPQYNKHSCFVACLESFFRDCGKTLDQEKTVKGNPDLFYGGAEIEGSCDTTSFPEVARRLGIQHQQISSSAFGAMYPLETILLHVYWEDDPKNEHCVRYYSQNNDKFTVMNPRRADKLDDMPIVWVRGIHKFSM